MILNDNIKLIRELSGKTQIDFAKLIGTNTSNLKTYENTDVKPKARVLAAIADLTALSVDILSSKRLTHKDIKFLWPMVEKDGKGEKMASNGLTGPEHDLDLRTLIDSNNKLATAMMGCQEDQRELIQMLKEERQRNRPTVRDPEQIDVALEKRLSDILMVVVEVGVGTKWKTKQEGIEAVNRFLDGTSAVQTKAGSRAGAHR